MLKVENESIQLLTFKGSGKITNTNQCVSLVKVYLISCLFTLFRCVIQLKIQKIG